MFHSSVEPFDETQHVVIPSVTTLIGGGKKAGPVVQWEKMCLEVTTQTQSP